MKTEDWTEEILSAAAWEIVSRGGPLGGPVKEGMPSAAIVVRLESELSALKREYALLDAKHQTLLKQFQ